MKTYTISLLLQSRSNDSTALTEALEQFRSYCSTAATQAAVEQVKVRTDVITKNGTVLRGGLTPFLSTPLKSDKDEIIRLIHESIDNTLRQFDIPTGEPSVRTALYRIVPAAEVPLQKNNIGTMKRLLKNGKVSLGETTASRGKGSNDRFVFRFSFEGISFAETILSLLRSAPETDQFSVVHSVLSAGWSSIPPSATGHSLVLLSCQPSGIMMTEERASRIAAVCSGLGLSGSEVSSSVFDLLQTGTIQIGVRADLASVPLGSIVSAIGDAEEELRTAINNSGALIVLEPLV